MSKTSPKIKIEKKIKADESGIDELIAEVNDLDIWDMVDPSDQTFWEEFFQLEDLLDVTDDFDPPTFSISVYNHQSKKMKTYSNIRLKSIRKKIVC